MTATDLPKFSVAEHLVAKIGALDVSRLPQAVREKCVELLIDVVGLAVTARNEDYVKRALEACDDDGPCTAIGHARTLSAAAAAIVNGTAIHGEDFDDTFEGGPIHAGAVVVPAVLAACERHNLDGRAALLGIAVGVETMCRLSTVAPTLTHKAGFHPTAVFGAMGATAGVGAAFKLTPRQMIDALGTAGSMASRHHRISRRRRLDQTAPCRLGGAIGHPRSAARPRRLPRAAHGVRRRARFLPRLRQHDQRRLRRADRRFRHALGDRDVGVQALSLRDHDASLYRLRAKARQAHQGRRCRRHGLRGRRGHRASPLGAACRQAASGERLCRQILLALLHRRGLRARQCGPKRFLRRGGARARGGRARLQGALSDRSAKSLSEELSPAISAPRCATARWSRSASPICAAARKSR